MSTLSPARRVALRLLARQRRRTGRARELLRSAPEMAALAARDRALATRLVLGANAALGTLDEHVDAYISHPGALEPRVRDALRLSAFEILYLDTPREIAVSQGVELVRSVCPRAARMANAVLRRVCADRAEIDAARLAVQAAAKDGSSRVNAAQLSAASGYPVWLAQRLIADRGHHAAACVCACALEGAPLYVAAGRKERQASLEARLVGAGLAPEADGLPNSWVLRAPAGLATSTLVESCECVVADLCAQLVCRVAAIGEGRLLEVGQGRGTKSLLLCSCSRELTGREGALHIDACDVVASNVRVSTQRMRTAGLEDVVTSVAFDATHLGCADAVPVSLTGRFDAALVDAPCSGSATMRRHPEIPWSLKEAALDPANPSSLPALQIHLLESAAACLAPGGSLVYATCSVLPAENEDVVNQFLASSTGAAFARADVLEAPGVAALPAAAQALVADRCTTDGDFQSIPATGLPDGHFCARLVRTD